MNNNPANSILSGLLILLIPIFSPITLNGQDLKEDLKDWIAEYILLNSQRNDASVPSMKIYNYYVNASQEDKLALEESVSKVAFTFVSEGKMEFALSATNLYELLPIDSQKVKSQIYFTKGYCYAALCDSINLKSAIYKLQRYPKTTFYTSVLNSYLDEMRKPVTSLKNLDGWWVSDMLYDKKEWYGALDDGILGHTPKYILKINELSGNIDFWLERRSAFNTRICNKTRGWVWDATDDIKSKIVMPYASDSICVIWSSEDLKNFNADIAQSLRQVTATIGATIAGEVNQRYKYSTSEKIATDMLVDLGETAINAIFDAIFTPSKKIFVLQARLKKVNDNLLTGKLYFRQTKAKADDSNIKWEEYIDTVTFLRWKPEYDVVFMGKDKEYPVMPYYDISKDVPSQIKSLKNKAKKGIKQSYDSKKGTGIFIDLKNDSVVINYVYSNSPAQKKGLKIGDCILSVNKVMVTGRKFQDLNAVSKIFDRGAKSTVTLEILRPSTGEVMVIDVTLGKVKVTDDDIDYVYKMHYENLIVPYWKDVRDDTTGRYGKAVLEYKQSKDKPAFLKEYNTRMINELYKHAINSSSNIK